MICQICGEYYEYPREGDICDICLEKYRDELEYYGDPNWDDEYGMAEAAYQEWVIGEH